MIDVRLPTALPHTTDCRSSVASGRAFLCLSIFLTTDRQTEWFRIEYYLSLPHGITPNTLTDARKGVCLSRGTLPVKTRAEVRTVAS